MQVEGWKWTNNGHRIPVYDAQPRYVDYTFINIKDKCSPFLK